MWYDPDAPQAQKAAQFAAEDSDRVEQRRLPAVSAALYAEALQGAPARIELLQGEHRPRQESSWQRWRPALIVAAAALVIHLGWSLWDLYAMRREARALTLRSEELFRSTFPEVKRVVDVAAQARQQLKTLAAGSASGDFVSLFAQVGSVLQTAPQVRVDGFAFSAGVLSLSMSASTAEMLAPLAQQIAAATGRQATIDDEQQAPDGVSARLTLKGANP
jgi:general secretion pathway protein L